MEQKFGINSLELQMLREFCEHEGKVVSYQKGERMECEGESANWFGFVTEGCFKYTTNGIYDGKEHITWFSFEGEYVGDYPNCLDGRPAQTTIEAMLPSRVFKVSGEQLSDMFHQNTKTMELRSIIAEHLLCQSRARYLDFYRATPFERYDLLLHRCPGIVEHLPLNAIASFLNVTPVYLSKIRKGIAFGSGK